MLELLALSCPQCGRALKCGEQSLVAHCQACNSLWLLKDKMLQPCQSKILALPDSILDNCRFLPFWRWQARWPESGLTVMTYVAAFIENNILHFGDPGRELTMEQPTLVAVTVPGREMPFEMVHKSAVGCFGKAQTTAWIKCTALDNNLALDKWPLLENEELVFLPFVTENGQKLVLCNGESHFLSTGIIS